MKIIHIITTASDGGAQSVLYTLLRGWDDPTDSHLVVSLLEEDAPTSRLRSSGVEIVQLDWKPRRLDPAAFMRLLQIIRKIQPDLIQTWLYHADLAGSLAALLSGCRPVTWSLHHTLEDLSALPRFDPYGRTFARSALAVCASTYCVLL